MIPSEPFSFVNKYKMIIHYSEGKSKENFYDRNKVMQMAYKMLESGEVVCPICVGMLGLHGTYRRYLKDSEAKRHEGWIAQSHCAGCKKYHSLIPSFIKPNKQYEAEVIEEAIKAQEAGELKRSDCPANETTIRRWVREFREGGSVAVGWLQSIIYNIYNEHISVVETKKEGLMTQLERLTGRLLGNRVGSVIGRANIILTKYNHGFL